MSARAPTGIDGLDELTGGGLPKGKNIVVSGVPGSGKTIFCAEFLYNGAMKYGEPGVLLTLEENPESILRNMAGFGMDFDGLIKKRLFKIMDANPVRGEVVLTPTGTHPGFIEFRAHGLIDMIGREVKALGAKRVAIDPMTVLLMYHNNDFERRLEIARLMVWLADLDCTVIITSEARSSELGRLFQTEHFTSDGVILLDLLQVGGGAVRGIQILKLRGIKHDFDYHLYHISDNGMEVFPKERIYVPKREDI